MAAGPEDSGNEIDAGAPERPAQAAPSVGWTDSGGMAAQQASANRMFEHHSEQMQAAAKSQAPAQEPDQPSDAKPQELTFAMDRGRAGYGDLKREQSGGDERDSGDADRDQLSGELTFASDRGRAGYADLKQEQSGGGELKFAMDRGNGADRGR